MNLPNTLTVSRLLLTVCFVWLISQNGMQSKITAFIIFIIATSTDFLDGYVARKYNKITDFGKLMDPIADKFLVLTAFFIFVRIEMIAWWMFLLIFIRECLITFWRFREMKRGIVLAAEKMGKYKTVAQILVIYLILVFLILQEAQISQDWSSQVFVRWHEAIYCGMLIAVSLTVISGFFYFWNNRQYLHAR